MYPFVLLDLPHDASDEQVTKRYRELVALYPPDHAPETFRAVRAAYEALRDRRARLRSRLLYFDRYGHAWEDITLPRLPGQARRRLDTDQLAALLKAAPASGLHSSRGGGDAS